MEFTQSKKKTLGWIGITVVLLLGVLIFFIMGAYAALSTSPNYPRGLAVFVMISLGGGLVLCLIAAIALAMFLCRAYDFRLLKSLKNWNKLKGGNPWD